MSDALGDQEIAGFAADALHALTPAQIAFLRALPKAELHAHLKLFLGVYDLPALLLKSCSNLLQNWLKDF